MTSKVYVGDAGTVIELDCGTDVSAATGRAIKVKKPDGSTVSWDAVAGTSTSIRYTSLAGTFDQRGEWLLQAEITTATGKWLGATARLMVFATWE
jgi:hypothetical protein